MAQTDRINGLIGTLGVKAPVRVAASSNITLSGLQTIDSISLAAGDRVLVYGQTTSSENGVYAASAGAWAREPDFDGERDVVLGTQVPVAAGTVLVGYVFRVSAVGAIGTDALSFEIAHTPSGVYTAGDAINTARATVASHATTADIWGAAGNEINFTGTASVSTFPNAPQAGTSRVLHCAGACTFVNGANLAVQGGEDYLASAGDIVLIHALTVSTFRAVVLPADGRAVIESYPNINEGRLSLSSTAPLPTTDVTAATTLYYLPFRGDGVTLYDGTRWNRYTIPALGASIALPPAADTNYDVFAYQNAGVVTLELVAWSGATTRATSLTRTNGILRKTGDLTRKYLGTVRTTSVAGESSDSRYQRFCWNNYNRALRWLEKYEATASWTYTTAAWRQANGDTANKVEFVTGLLEDAISVTVAVDAANSSASVSVRAGVGYDSVAAVLGHSVTAAGPAGVAQTLALSVLLSAAAGYHYLAWLEHSNATGTTTWYSNSANGIEATVFG